MHEPVVPERSFLDTTSNIPLDVPFTASVARAEGVPAYLLSQWCRHGLLRQPIRRVYVAAQVPDSIMLRAQCLALVMPEDCVIVDRHAGWLHGAEMVLAPNEHLNVMPLQLFRLSGHGRLRNGLSTSGERNLRPHEITEIYGLPLSTIVRTAWDLGRVRSRQGSISGIDQMMRLPGFPREEFLAGIERFRGQRWVSNLRTLGPLATGRAESPGESAILLGWHDAGLPSPEPQLEFWENGQLVASLDVGNDLIGYGAEYDGDEFHSSPEQREHDRERRTWVEGHDFVVDAFTWHHVYGPHRNLEEMLLVGAARARAERRSRGYVLLG